MAICTRPDRHEFGTGFRWQLGAAHESAPRRPHPRSAAHRARQSFGERLSVCRRHRSGSALQPHALLRLDRHAVRFLRDRCDAVTQVDLDVAQARAASMSTRRRSPRCRLYGRAPNRASKDGSNLRLDDGPSTLAASQPHAALRVLQWGQSGVDSQRGENPRAVRADRDSRSHLARLGLLLDDLHLELPLSQRDGDSQATNAASRYEDLHRAVRSFSKSTYSSENPEVLSRCLAPSFSASTHTLSHVAPASRAYVSALANSSRPIPRRRYAARTTRSVRYAYSKSPSSSAPLRTLARTVAYPAISPFSSATKILPWHSAHFDSASAKISVRDPSPVGPSAVESALKILEFDQAGSDAIEICIAVILSDDHDETPNVRVEQRAAV